MLRDSLEKTFLKVVALQFLLAIVSAVIAGFTSGTLSALSALAGGFTVLCGGAIYALLARGGALSAASARSVLGRHLAAEGAKILTIVVLMFLALASGWFAAGWLVVAMGVVLLGHWLAFLIIK